MVPGKLYQRFLYEEKREFQPYWLGGESGSRNAHLILEFSGADRRTLTRVVMCVPHMERISRYRTFKSSNDQIFCAAQERLLDFASLLVFGHSRLPAWLSGTGYFCCHKNGSIVPLKAFESFDPVAHDTLSGYFRRPCVNVNIRQWPDKVLQLEDKAKAILKVCYATKLTKTQRVRDFCRTPGFQTMCSVTHNTQRTSERIYRSLGSR
jgi:hypothetical protein